VSDDLERVSPRGSAHARARDRKVRPPKVISVNPGLRKLALHLAEKRKKSLDGLEPRTARIVSRVRAIPAGFVRTYGDIDPGAPRLVGRVLSTTQADIPWHRVVRADGSLPKGRQQRELLMREGIPLRGDRVDLRKARMTSSPGG
jgi:methylated-DNA-protein-cysteine methyltransferase-like protein